MQKTVLAIEDCPAVRRIIGRTFAGGDYDVVLASDGQSGVSAFQSRRPSVVLLDRRLPDLPGEEICRLCFGTAPAVPIIVLSADSAVESKVTMFELGAMDYVTKPFSPRELMARVERAIQRSARHDLPGPQPQGEIMFADVRVNLSSHQVTRRGIEVPLTAQEFRLLSYFLLHPRIPVSRAELLQQVWGYQSYPCTRTVDNHILRLRQKLEPDPASPRHFITLHGAGYKFITHPAESASA